MGSKPSIIYILMTLAVAIAPAFAHAGSLPPLINFQSVLLDEGGNLLPSGPTTVQFQILDENHAAIYAETQNVDVVKGAVNALIGNGTDSKGVTTGGIPEDIFAGGAPRYLQVQVGSHAPEDPMTIVPVPYAQWSETCATVMEGGIKSSAIAKAAVGFEALAPDVVSKLAAEMSKSQGVVTAQSLGSNGGATQVGVEAKFINSGSASVQGVLQDLDLSVKKSQEAETFLKGKLNQEVSDRTNAVKGVQNQLDMTTQSTMKTVINNLQDVTSNINNIPGTLSLSRVQTTAPAPGDLNMNSHNITNLASPVNDQDAATRKYVLDNFKKAPSDLNMDGHKISSLGTPTDSKDATTKEYVDKTIASSAQSAPLPIGGIVAGTYVGNGNATQVITLSAQVTPRIIFLREPSGTYLASDFALFFSSGLTNYSAHNASMSEGGVVRWDQGYANPGISIKSVGAGSLTVEGNANVSGVTYSYIIMGS